MILSDTAVFHSDVATWLHWPASADGQSVWVSLRVAREPIKNLLLSSLLQFMLFFIVFLLGPIVLIWALCSVSSYSRVAPEQSATTPQARLISLAEPNIVLVTTSKALVTRSDALVPIPQHWDDTNKHSLPSSHVVRERQGPAIDGWYVMANLFWLLGVYIYIYILVSCSIRFAHIRFLRASPSKMEALQKRAYKGLVSESATLTEQQHATRICQLPLPWPRPAVAVLHWEQNHPKVLPCSNQKWLLSNSDHQDDADKWCDQ